MFQQLRESGPGLLVPLAWLFVAAAAVGVVESRSIFIAHLVMAAFITFFLTTGWADMSTGALTGWRAVMVVGLGVTLAGVAGFLVDAGSTVLWTTSLVGWMLLPAAGLAYTGRLLDEAAEVYIASAAISGLGAVVYILSLVGYGDSIGFVGLGGLALVGLGQTVGIVDAVVRF
ncbi:hypothetical protein [Halohasta litorea]|uniref:Uncharacterized protein n=1 Tax=Halohasta litorea TaxID=869891 RepID=A0ABD6D8H2_9EURY|nr:hypothetical protein [Halohasta litorea]